MPFVPLLTRLGPERRSSDDLGTFEIGETRWQAGDEFRASGNVRYRITATLPREGMAEFVDVAEVEVDPLSRMP